MGLEDDNNANKNTKDIIDDPNVNPISSGTNISINVSLTLAIFVYLFISI